MNILKDYCSLFFLFASFSTAAIRCTSNDKTIGRSLVKNSTPELMKKKTGFFLYDYIHQFVHTATHFFSRSRTINFLVLTLWFWIIDLRVRNS
jgi:hypothetical protein